MAEDTAVRDTRSGPRFQRPGWAQARGQGHMLDYKGKGKGKVKQAGPT